MADPEPTSNARRGLEEKARRAARNLANAAAVLAHPLAAPPGSYLSPLPSDEDIRRARSWKTSLPGIDLREVEQIALVGELSRYWSELGAPGARYESDNNMYGESDATIFWSMLRHFKPPRIVEVGSGYSTALALDYRERHDAEMRITAIEPRPARLQSRLRPNDSIDLQAVEVQDLDASAFDLQAGDVLFIDSSHVAKHGSDVIFLLLEVLPALPSGVLVHIHDIFWPFTYPTEWLDARWAWNETYVLRGLLTWSTRFEILLWSSWMWSEHPDLVPIGGPGPGSLWLRVSNRA